jgi:type VI secretion system protein ImpC
MTGTIDFAFRFARDAAPRRRDGGRMKILVLGDFSGTADDRGDLASRPILQVDVDTFDGLMAKLSPRIDVPELGIEAFRPRSLDDLHPDHLFHHLELFREMRGLRARLEDPKTFAEAAAGLKRAAGGTAREPRPSSPPTTAPAETTADTFARLLGSAPTNVSTVPTAPARGHDTAGRLIERLVAPYVVAATDPEQRMLIGAVDDGIAGTMRAVLHAPAFQRIEAPWRGLNWLINGVETGDDLSVHLLDVGQDELMDDLTKAEGEPERTALVRRLVEKGRGTLGGEPWSVVVAIFTFGPGNDDIRLLAHLSAIAAANGAALLARASPALVGAPDLAATPDPNEWRALPVEVAKQWQRLRSSPLAPWIGLALPRILLRRPYGRKSEPIEAFAFEELTGSDAHEHYLWGNPAFGVAILLGRAFLVQGWGMSPGDETDLDDLPQHTVHDDGIRLMPCAEIFLSDRASERIMGEGLMPFLSHQGLNQVKLARAQSIAHPPRALAGPWG